MGNAKDSRLRYRRMPIRRMLIDDHLNFLRRYAGAASDDNLPEASGKPDAAFRIDTRIDTREVARPRSPGVERPSAASC
jgi:hypothetical protein